MTKEIVIPIVYIKFEIKSIKKGFLNDPELKKYRYNAMNTERVKNDIKHKVNAIQNMLFSARRSFISF